MLGRGTSETSPGLRAAKCAAGGEACGRRRRPHAWPCSGAALCRCGGQAVGARASRHGGLRTGSGGSSGRRSCDERAGDDVFDDVASAARREYITAFPESLVRNCAAGWTRPCCRCGCMTLREHAAKAGFQPTLKPSSRLPASSVAAITNRPGRMSRCDSAPPKSGPTTSHPMWSETSSCEGPLRRCSRAAAGQVGCGSPDSLGAESSRSVSWGPDTVKRSLTLRDASGSYRT